MALTTFDAQCDRARAVASQLRDNGHDVTGLDLLDAMASAGCRLEYDVAGVAPAAYSQLVQTRLPVDGPEAA